MFLYEETMRIPLLMSFPGSIPEGKVLDDLAGIVDVMPTVLDLLNITPPKPCHGESLLPLIQSRDPEPGEPVAEKSASPRTLYLETYGPSAVYGWSELLGVVARSWKFIQAPRCELYDLYKDPLERSNRYEAEPERSAALRSALAQIIATTSSNDAGAVASLTDEQRQRIESLGYVTGGQPTSGTSDRPDPKDMIEVAAAQSQAERLAETDPQAAVAAFQELLARHPDNAAAHSSLGEVLMRLNRLDEAIAHLQRATELRQDAVQTYRLLAFARFRAGQHAEALQAIEASLAVNPESDRSLFLKSLILDAQDETDRAATAAYEALKINPSLHAARFHYGRLLARQGRSNEALKVLEAIPPESTARFAARQEMARIYGSTGRSAEQLAAEEEVARLRAAGAAQSPAIPLVGGGY